MWKILLLGFILRLGVIIIGDYIDSYFYPVQFTDIDYRVYSEAAEYVYNGKSPYERQTYRYPPVLAIVLVGNFLFHRFFGKIIFALFDVLISKELMEIIDETRRDEKFGNWWLTLWCFNPLSIYICCRGSSDSISSWFVLFMIKLMIQNRFDMAAIVLGLTIFIRIYPIIYFPVFVLYLSSPLVCSKYVCASSVYSMIIKFIIIAVCSTSLFGIISYYFYGNDYLNHAVSYHLSRSDHRHNFSPMFYSLYLQKFNAIKQWQYALLNKIPLFCQCLLLITISFQVCKKYSLQRCMLLLTMVFVAFNSVITGQYFLWYLVLFPITFPDLDEMKNRLLVPCSLLGLSLCLWVYNGYKLEFLGENTFFDTWLASLLFVVAHSYMIYVCL